jgi:hypothetical protein
MIRNRVLVAVAAVPAALLVTLVATGTADAVETGVGADPAVVRADDRDSGARQLPGLPLGSLTGVAGPLGNLLGSTGALGDLLGSTGPLGGLASGDLLGAGR